MIGYQIHTFGCKVNTYDTSLLEKQLDGLYFRPSSHPDIHIFNTCAVTHEAIKKAQKQIRKYRLQNPNAKIVVTGCGAQADTDQFSQGVDLIVANSHKEKLQDYLLQMMKGTLSKSIFKSNIFEKKEMGWGGGLKSERTRAFLKIQDGCNSFCTYCIIPFARGKSRSLDTNLICEKIQEFVVQGIQEVVLTGVHIGDYGYQKNGQVFYLTDLIASILKKTTMPRIRLTSLEPLELSESLMELYQDPRLCPHFHVSVQSVSSNILKRMRRKYTASDVENALLNIDKKVKQAFVGMDVIVGFSGESRRDFNNTYHKLEGLPWNFIHVFPYSQRRGTRASKWPDDVPTYEKKWRSKKLRNLSQRRFLETSQKQIGQKKQVLLLGQKKGSVRKLLSRDYWQCILEKNAGFQIEGKQEIDVMITGQSFVNGDLLLSACPV